MWPTSSSSRTTGGAAPTRRSTTACTSSAPICSAPACPTPSEREALTAMRTTKLFGTAILGLLLGVIACHNDELFRPVTIQPVNPLFTRYVSLGNSITAGWQSDGINDSTQVQSYANLLAGRLQTPFFQPLMNRPGCPPPIDTLFRASGTPHRVGGGPGRRGDGRHQQPRHSVQLQHADDVLSRRSDPVADDAARQSDVHHGVVGQ